MRNTTSSIGAQIPIDWYVGNKPIKNVAIPIINSEMISIVLRPILSP